MKKVLLNVKIKDRLLIEQNAHSFSLLLRNLLRCNHKVGEESCYLENKFLLNVIDFAVHTNLFWSKGCLKTDPPEFFLVRIIVLLF